MHFIFGSFFTVWGIPMVGRGWRMEISDVYWIALCLKSSGTILFTNADGTKVALPAILMEPAWRCMIKTKAETVQSLRMVKLGLSELWAQSSLQHVHRGGSRPILFHVYLISKKNFTVNERELGHNKILNTTVHFFNVETPIINEIKQRRKTNSFWIMTLCDKPFFSSQYNDESSLMIL